METFTRKAGFTYLTPLFVVAVAVLVWAIYQMILDRPMIEDPADMRNNQRNFDINVIMNGIYQSMIDGREDVLPAIPLAATCGQPPSKEICRLGASCGGLVDLSVLVEPTGRLEGIPNDPSWETDRGTGYFISKREDDTVTACAPHAENGAVISVSR